MTTNKELRIRVANVGTDDEMVRMFFHSRIAGLLQQRRKQEPDLHRGLSLVVLPIDVPERYTIFGWTTLCQQDVPAMVRLESAVARVSFYPDGRLMSQNRTVTVEEVIADVEPLYQLLREEIVNWRAERQR